MSNHYKVQKNEVEARKKRRARIKRERRLTKKRIRYTLERGME